MFTSTNLHSKKKYTKMYFFKKVMLPYKQVF